MQGPTLTKYKTARLAGAIAKHLLTAVPGAVTRSLRSANKTTSRTGSLEHYLIRFLLHNLIDLVAICLSLVIDQFLAAFKVVFGDYLVFFLLLEMFDRVSSDIPYVHFGLLAGLLGLNHKLLSSLPAQRRDIQSDDLPVDNRGDAKVAALDGLFDLLNRARIERLDNYHIELRRSQSRHLL